MITSKICNICKKKAILDNEFTIAGLLYQNFTCGHTQIVKKLEESDFKNFKSIDGFKPRPFQIIGATWAMNSNGRFLIMDEMGLGKTIQFLMVADSIKNSKYLIVCKSSLKIQWAKESYRWLNESLVQIIESEKEFILPGCKGFVISYDLLWRFKDIPAFIKKLGINLIGLDEVQHLKNTDSKRTNGVRIACKEVDYIGALSGTPIKNSACEFFPILNILHPEKFPTAHSFEAHWIESYWDGHKMKYGGLKDYDRFHNYTKEFILRRTREEVLPELPTITRDFRFSELGTEVEQAYKETLKQFQSYCNSNGNGDSNLQKSANILSYLTRMRHLTGLAKVTPVIEYLTDFIEETDRKIVVFVHHKDVAYSIYSQLQALRLADDRFGVDILNFESDLSPEARDSVIQKFTKDKNYRIMIALTLAASEGLNLQEACSDCILLERQWNPANEEQAEARFIRIGQTSDKVNAMYPVAIGTVDEFFAEIVERKRSICANTLDGKDIEWNQSSIIAELTELLLSKGGKKWGF